MVSSPSGAASPLLPALSPIATVATPGPAPLGAPSVVEFGTRRTLVVAGVMLAALLQTLDSTIVNVALPTIQGNLGASIDEGTWVFTAYIIAAVVVIPIAPYLQNRFGRKRYFLVSIAGFTLASLACGLAGTIGQLIVFRVVQGLFGGGLLATAQAILRDTFPPSQLGLSQSIYTVGALVGPSAGPTLGGILTDNVSWRWVFDVNIVPGIVAFAILALVLRDPPRQAVGRFDATGLSLLAIGLGSFQFVLDEGERNDWFSDPLICLLVVTGIAGTAAFVVWELRGTRFPIVDLRVFRNRGVAVGCGLAMVNASVVFGQLLVMPQYLTSVLGFTATQDGLLLAIRALPILFISIVIGGIANSPRVDPRWLIAAGLATTGSGVVWLGSTVTSTTTFGAIVPCLLLTGLGISCVFAPLLVSVLRGVQGPDSPKAGAFISLALNLGGSIASASLVTILDRRESFHGTVLGDDATFANPNVRHFLVSGTLRQLAAIVQQQSATLAYADTFLLLGAFAIVMAPLAFALPGRPRGVRLERVHAAGE